MNGLLTAVPPISDDLIYVARLYGVLPCSAYPNEPVGKAGFGRVRLVSNKGKLLKIASRSWMEGKTERT